MDIVRVSIAKGDDPLCGEAAANKVVQRCKIQRWITSHSDGGEIMEQNRNS